MGNRLTRIYTGTGDTGSTGLGDGTRVAKDHPRVAAMGDIDELNSWLGMLLCEIDDESLAASLTDIQQRLFDLGGELSIPGYTMIEADHVSTLEALIDSHNALLPPLRDFVLPRGNRAAVTAHLARTVCRRAERTLTTIARDTEINANGLAYLNRLSDLLFVLARSLARAGKADEMLWRDGKGR